MIIGITGQAGVGKSFAATQIQNHFDIQLIDLDHIGHDLLKEDAVKDALTKCFGVDIIDESGEINRPTLGKVVFGSSEQLNKLNAIMHPHIRERCLSLATSHRGLSVIVGALLSEIDLLSDLKHNIHIWASDANLAKHSADKAHIRAMQRCRKQYDAEADFSLENSFTKQFSSDIIQHIHSLLGEATYG